MSLIQQYDRNIDKKLIQFIYCIYDFILFFFIKVREFIDFGVMYLIILLLNFLISQILLFMVMLIFVENIFLVIVIKYFFVKN